MGSLCLCCVQKFLNQATQLVFIAKQFIRQVHRCGAVIDAPYVIKVGDAFGRRKAWVKLSERKGELQGMSTASDGTVRLEFHIPSRGLIGFRGEFLTSTKGTGIINTMFDGYAPYKGDFQYRKQGSLIAFEAGEAVTYGLFAAQERGTLFIGPGAKVYSGMVIGQNGKAEDIELNVCKTKHLTNTRSSSADDALKLVPPKVLSLEQAIEFIDQDELLEVTPKSLRIRKRILDSRDRKRAAFRKS